MQTNYDKAWIYLCLILALTALLYIINHSWLHNEEEIIDVYFERPEQVDSFLLANPDIMEGLTEEDSALIENWKESLTTY